MSESDERTVCAAGAGLERSGEKRFVQTHGSASTERHPAVIDAAVAPSEPHKNVKEQEQTPLLRSHRKKRTEIFQADSEKHKDTKTPSGGIQKTFES
jgi:hypothetical protein